MPIPFHRFGNPLVQDLQGALMAALEDTLYGPPGLQSIQPRGSYRSFDELAPGADRRGLILENPNSPARIAAGAAALVQNPSPLYTNMRRRAVGVPLADAGATLPATRGRGTGGS